MTITDRLPTITFIIALVSVMLNAVLITELSNANELTDAYRDETVRIGNMYVCGEEEAYMAYLIAENFTVTRFNDKSVWFGSVRKSWNTLVDAINKKTYQKVST